MFKVIKKKIGRVWNKAGRLVLNNSRERRLVGVFGRRNRTEK